MARLIVFALVMVSFVLVFNLRSFQGQSASNMKFDYKKAEASYHKEQA